jgi:hypothetical protein
MSALEKLPVTKSSTEEKTFRSKLDEISTHAEEFKKKTYSATGVVDTLTRIFPGVFDRPQPYGLMVAALRSANAFKTSLSDWNRRLDQTASVITQQGLKPDVAMHGLKKVTVRNHG